VHRPALEGVVEVLAMRSGAVDQRGVGRRERRRVADRRARPAGVEPRHHRLHVVGAARGDAQADDVDQQLLHALAHVGGQTVSGERRNGGGELFGNGGGGQGIRHGCWGEPEIS